MNTLILLAVAAIALPVLGAAGCRLIQLHVTTHRLAYIGLFLGFALGSIKAVSEAWNGEASLSTVGLLAGAACYLWVSRVTWRTGPPSFTEK